MPKRQLPRLKPGDFLAAEDLNILYAEIERLNLTIGPNMVLSKTKSGMNLASICPDQFWIKITGDPVTMASGAVIYPWTEQIPDASGDWGDSLRVGTTNLDGAGLPLDDPARESNNNATVPSDGTVIVLATRTGGVLGFTYRACG